MDTKETLKNRIFTLVKAVFHWFSENWDRIATVALTLCIMAGCIWYCLRYTVPEETVLRHKLVETAEVWLGYQEADGSHQEIIDLYNATEPNPRDYKVTYEDNWCATFGSAAAIAAGLTDIIPLECSCQQQIALFESMGCWEENDGYLPKTGDYIYYVWDEWRKGDCTAWASHVGIVAETFGPVIKVIEGNKDDSVAYRYIFINDICIRGYGLPDYGKLCQSYTKTAYGTP